MTRPEQSESLDDFVRQACAGRPEALHRFFMRRGGLPGPRPNYACAKDVATRLLGAGKSGRQVIESLASLDAYQAAAESPQEFFVVTGVVGLGIAVSRERGDLTRSKGLHELQPFAEDPRKHVRDAVHVALGEVITARGDDAVAALGAWTDGYLQSDAVLRAMTLPEAEQQLRSADHVVARLDEAFTLVEKAPRAHERSHGCRALVRALADVPPQVGKRFAPQVAAWMQTRATTQVPELRDALQKAVDKLRRTGAKAGDLDGVQRTLDASAPVARDPRSYVGPTRRRGKR